MGVATFSRHRRRATARAAPPSHAPEPTHTDAVTDDETKPGDAAVTATPDAPDAELATSSSATGASTTNERKRAR